MDVKKFVQMSFSISNFTDEEVNRIMQDESARSSFTKLVDCYKTDDQSKKIECLINKTLINICGKENNELVQCLQQHKGKQQSKCYSEITQSQRCIDEQLHNILLVSRGMS